MMQRLVNDGVPFKLTMSLTPTLCAMLQDELLRERYVQHVDLLIDLMERECERNRDDAKLLELARFYSELFAESRRFFVDEWNCDLIAAFRRLRETGSLEIIASAATHAVLPLHSRESQRAQVLIGRDAYVDVFDVDPMGFWLPECAYAPGLETILQEANLRWFILDAHGLMFGNPRPRRAIYAPCYTPAGRPRSRGIAIRAGKFGAQRKVIRAIRPIANFIATSDGNCRSNISVRSRAECENFPA